MFSGYMKNLIYFYVVKLNSMSICDKIRIKVLKSNVNNQH